MSILSRVIPESPNAVAVLTALIKKLNVPVSSFTIKKDLLDHPDYPSLLALSDCLSNWKIPNEAYRIDKEEYKAEELSFPFITHIALNGGGFILVKEIGNGKVKYSDEKKQNRQLTEGEFLEIWNGIILYGEKNEQSGEAHYKDAAIKGLFDRLRWPFLIAVLLTAIFLTINYSGTNWTYFTLLGVKFAGIVVCALLLMYSIDANNPFIQNLCSLGKKNNCNAILKSDVSKVTSWLSWSEVGMFYFSGSFLALLFLPGAGPVLGWLSLACIPYTFYSISYQIKTKNWCVLCCTVQALIWFEAAVFLFGGVLRFQLSSFDLSAYAIFILILCFLFPIAVWAVIKPFMLKSEQVGPLKQQLNKFKYNSDLFSQMLTNQPRFSVPNDIMPIKLGNPEAEHVITMVTNPFCGPCAVTHKKIDEWLEVNDNLFVKIVFTTSNHDDDPKTKVARHLTALSLLDDKKHLQNALNDWYASEKKDYDAWSKDYPVQFNGEMESVIEKQKDWCKMAEVTFTPTILVNGYKLVEPYRLEDIKYLLS